MRQRQRAPACPACEHRQQYYAAAVRPPQRDSMQGACRAQRAWPGTEYVLKRWIHLLSFQVIGEALEAYLTDQQHRREMRAREAST
jgi:hypothetical protein